MMKIAILTSGILPIPAVRGGAVENLIDFCLEYNDRQRLHDITVYSVDDPATEGHPALQSQVNHYRYIDTHSLAAKVRKHLYKATHRDRYYDYTIEYYLAQTLKQLRRQDYDLILIENRPGYVLKLKESLRVPLAIHQENDFLNAQTHRAQDIYAATSLIINTSDYITRRVRTICPGDRKCRTVLNGIDTARFEQAQPFDRSTVGLSPEDFVIVYSGRLTPDKGILQLILAIDKLRDLPNLRLLIIGASAYGQDKHPSPFILQLQEAAMPVKNRIVFTGFVDYRHIPSYLKMADMAAVPSMWDEPFGLTVVEAMSAGLPLVTTRSGGIPEICEGIATLVDRDGIVDHLADAIRHLYHHPEERRAMGEAARLHARRFDKQRYAADFFRALETLSGQDS